MLDTVGIGKIFSHFFAGGLLLRRFCCRMSTAMNYAVVPLAGTQFLVSEGDEIQLNRVSQKEGETFSIIPLLVSKDKALEVGMPETKNYQVSLSVVEHTKGEKLYVRRFKSKSRYRKKKGHRQLISVLRVEEIVKIGKSKQKKAAGETPEVEESAGEVELGALDLSTRTENALKKAGKTDISNLKKMSKEELKEIPGVGKKSAEEIIKKLK